MSTGLATSRRLAGDVRWFVLAAAVSLLIGTILDRLLRHPPLGWTYQTAAERLVGGASPSGEGITPVSSVDLEDLERLRAQPHVLILDARPRLVYEIGHLPGALPLSREQFEQDFSFLASRLKAPGVIAVVYCSDSTCEDGAAVAELLSQRGTTVKLFAGGFAEWEAAGLPVEVTP